MIRDRLRHRQLVCPARIWSRDHQGGGRLLRQSFSRRSLEITAPDYGFGATPEAAADGARERYKEEEGGEQI